MNDIPAYQPSSAVTRVPGATVLSSPDSVGKVSVFYSNLFENGGWQTVSKTVTDMSATLVVTKPGRGATVAIASTSSGTSISISTYPS